MSKQPKPMHPAYATFRAEPTPANAVALALADFMALGHGTADGEFTDALRAAERQLRAQAL